MRGKNGENKGVYDGKKVKITRPYKSGFEDSVSVDEEIGEYRINDIRTDNVRVSIRGLNILWVSSVFWVQPAK